MESFRAFAGGVQEAIAAADPRLIRQTSLVSEYECDGSRPLELDVCLDPSGAILDGSIVTGVYAALLNSDFGTLRSIDQVARRFEAFVRDAAPTLTDADGGGQARLYALTHTAAENARSFGALPGDDVFQAVMTAIPGEGASSEISYPVPVQPGSRLCLIHRFLNRDGQWRLFAEAIGICDGWLGTDRCDWCYDYWELWPEE
jgi:hypothetical protein